MQDLFRRFAQATSLIVGSAWAFLVALAVVIVWALTGPLFGFSDTWQLVINTSTTIVTFLMVFLIQNTQNRDARALHLKLDELIRGVSGARTNLVGLEEMSDEELQRLHDEFERVGKQRAQKTGGRAKVAHADAGSSRSTRTNGSQRHAAKRPNG